MRYEYECANCGTIYEKNHSIKENPEYFCDQCNNKLKRNISNNSNIIFKGWGWNDKSVKRKKSFIEKNAKLRRKARQEKKDGRKFFK